MKFPLFVCKKAFIYFILYFIRTVAFTDNYEIKKLKKEESVCIHKLKFVTMVMFPRNARAYYYIRSKGLSWNRSALKVRIRL